jgi:hypothetical protein
MLTRRLLLACALSAAVAPTLAELSREEVKTRIEAAGNAARHDADSVVVFDHTLVNVQPSGIGESQYHVVTKILRDGAIRGAAVRRFPFDPTTNRLTINAVRVYRADGSVEELDVSKAVRQPSTAGTIFWGEQQYLLDVPRLHVGDALETLYTKVGFNVAYLAAGEGGDGPALEPPMPGHWYDEVGFWSGVPVIEKRYAVRAPKDKPIQYGVYNGEVRSAIEFDSDHVLYTFEKRDIPAFKSEPAMVSAGDVAPKLVLATLEDWKAKSRWFYEKNEHAFEPDDALRAKTAEIIAGRNTDEAKIAALNHWVAENIRYVGTSRGACEGYTTHTAIETFRDRGGVCKDKAGILVSMLRIAGFESYIVMTMAGAEVFPAPADQFNHAVTSIRKPDGSMMLLDPTWAPKSRDLWSTFEAEQHVVYGTPEGMELARAQYFPPEHNLAVWRGNAELGPDGRLTGKLEFEAQGAPETLVRRRLNNRHVSERASIYDETFASLAPTVRLRAAQMTGPVDFSGPAKGAFEYEVESYTLGTRERRCFRLPGLQGALANIALSDIERVGNADKKERKYAAKVRATRLARFEETVRLPAGWTVKGVPEAVALDSPAASLQFSIDKSPGAIHYTCELSVKRTRISPEDFAEFAKTLDQFDKLANEYVICETETTHAQR